MTQEYLGSTTQESRGGSHEARKHGTKSYEDTKAAIRSAYDKTTKAVQSGYNRTMEYGNEHPQRFSLLTFAAGVGAGTLLASTIVARQSRTERLASPLIGVVADIARSLVRR